MAKASSLHLVNKCMKRRKLNNNHLKKGSKKGSGERAGDNSTGMHSLNKTQK